MYMNYDTQLYDPAWYPPQPFYNLWWETLDVNFSSSGSQLAYDDGGLDNALAMSTAGDHMAVRFSLPDGWPSARVLNARYYIDYAAFFKAHIFGSDGITNLVTPLEVDPENGYEGWFKVDFTSYSIVVSGDFWISIEYTTGCNPWIGADDDAPDDRSYYGQPGAWTGIGTWDLMIRADVDPPRPSLDLSAPEISGLTVTINGATLPGYPGTSIEKIHWNWRDGASEDAWFPATHTYGHPGIYRISVTSYQSDGWSTTKDVEVWVGPAGGTRSFLHPYTEFWFSRYDMQNAQWDAIHVVNVGSGDATIHIAIGTSVDETFTLPEGNATFWTFPGKADGPIHVSSEQPIWATQRILGWTAMQEIYGMPDDVGSTDIIFTWYDLANAQSDDIYVINPSESQNAEVDLFVAGVFRDHLDIGPGQAAVTSFPGVIGGPLRILSSIPVFASQRVIGFGDFAEIIGLPSLYTFTETWFNWYDMLGASWDAVHVLNPGANTANVEIYIAATPRASLSLPPGRADYRTFPGVIGGPVRVTSDQPIWVTQRIIGWGGWKEVFGVPTALATAEWYFTWYDMQGASWNAIHVINPSGTTADVTVYVGDELQSNLLVATGDAAYVKFPGVMTGPVRVVSNNDVAIMSSQRILGWGSFEETIGASLTT
jgi:hypothetical protein